MEHIRAGAGADETNSMHHQEHRKGNQHTNLLNVVRHPNNVMLPHEQLRYAASMGCMSQNNCAGQAIYAELQHAV